MTTAEVKRRLPIGTVYRGEFLFDPPDPAMKTTTRKIVKQGAEMSSEFLDGPQTGEMIYLTWKGVSAREESGEIILANNGREILKITLL